MSIYSIFFVDNDDDWKQLKSFLTGAFIMGVIWLLNGLQNIVPDNYARDRSRRNDNDINRNCGEDVDDDDDDDDDDLSFVDPWNAPLVYVSTQQRRMMRSSMTSMSNMKNHIGELPKRLKREHWPWETIRRRFATEDEENDSDDNNRNNNNKINKVTEKTHQGNENEIDNISIVVTEEEKKEDKSITSSSSTTISTQYQLHSSDSSNDEDSCNPDEKQLCIGSIFGLDVGGTLAKLVYFEKKTIDSDPLQTRNIRKKHYVQAVSAQTVLMARMEDNKHPIEGAASLSPSKRLQRSNSYDEKCNNNTTTINTTTLDQMSKRHKLSVSRMYRTKEIYQAQKEDPIEEEGQEISQKTTKDKKLAEDLKNLYAIRQESLPDDVRQFRHSIDFPSASEEVFYGDDIHRCESKDGEEFGTFVYENDDGNNNSHNNNDDDKEIDGRNRVHNKNNNQSEPLVSSSNNPPKRSMSMLELSAIHDQQKAEALDRFYDFARRLDTHQDSISDIKLSFYCRELGGEFHFIRFETRKMKNAMDLIRINNLHMNIRNMGATGGGAHKFADVWKKELGIGMFKQDELDSLVAGMQFVLSTVVGECYTFRPKKDSMTEQSTTEVETDNSTSQSSPGSTKSEQDLENIQREQRSDKSKNRNKTLQWWCRKVQRDSISYSSAYPYMVVTIGTGVSVLRVDGPRQHERVSGSTIGGGTFWGLMRLLTDVESFEDSMKLAEMGDLSKVDMMVGDIYGENSDALDKLGLAANIVASSFGKLVSKEDPAKGLTQEDLARALLSLVTNNIGQVAYLNAKLHNTPRIYFVGSFLRENMISQRRLSYAIDYWSKGEMEALFLEHEGYFGALGAFLMSQKIEKRKSGFFQ